MRQGGGLLQKHPAIESSLFMDPARGASAIFQRPSTGTGLGKSPLFMCNV